MAELIPIPFSKLMTRMYYEYSRCAAIFDLPKRNFYQPGELDLSVVFCGNPAANPAGPAAGPHTQMAQNIALSWLAGARIIELKTVQIKDRLELTRPCINMATVGYNTEWSQELRLEESAREYVKASMLIEIVKHWLFSSHSDVPIKDVNLDTIFDTSVGYDLAGIQSSQIRGWLMTMQNAAPLIEELRSEIPAEFAQYRDLPFKTKISDSITLSTFHGTPADEIERIVRFLLEEMGFHVVVKMNPPMLGKERLEDLLHDKLGYTGITVNPKAYDVSIRFNDAVAMMRQLQDVAVRNGKTVGVKFGNTLEVINTGTYLKDPVQYLSGQPLHILHLALVHEWRKEFGDSFPISFAGGVDANNFADCVAIGLSPVTTCTDLLRPGGYGRLPQYLINLERRMKSLGAKTIHELVLLASEDARPTDSNDPKTVILQNTSALLKRSISSGRYHSDRSARSPRKIASRLYLWDCINCGKCIPVCPNDANFFFDIEPVQLEYNNIERTNGTWRAIAGGVFKVDESRQIANFADACNHCGNCDVFCPEDGGPYIEKPRFFGSLDSYRTGRAFSGFVFLHDEVNTQLLGRFQEKEFELILDMSQKSATFKSSTAVITLEWNSHKVLEAVFHNASAMEVVNMKYYLVMATLMKGMMNTRCVNFVNAETNPS
jgi:putative selenate reductase